MKYVTALVVLAIWMTDPEAAPVSLSFTGTIVSTDPTGPYAGLSGSITGRITYDPSGADQYPLPGTGNYMFVGDPYRFHVELPGASITAPHSGVGVYDNGAGFYSSDTIELTTKYEAIGYLVILHGPNGSFAGEAIPPASLITSFWESGSFQIWGPDFNTWLVGSIDSVSKVAKD